MNMKSVLLSCFLFVSLIMQAQKPDVKDLHVGWEIVENNYKGKREFLAAFTLTNKGKQALPASGWAIYFNFPRMIHAASVSPKMQIRHINGDFYELKPAAQFKGLKTNDTVRIEYSGGAWVVSISDAPAGIYLVWDDAPQKGLLLSNYIIKKPTEAKQHQRYEGDKFAMLTPQMIFERNKNIKDIPVDSLVKVFPTPSSYKETGGVFTLNIKNLGVVSNTSDDFEKEASYLNEELNKLFVSKKGAPSTPIILTKNNMKGEAYKLLVNKTGIEISAGTPSGIFYGIQSLKTLIPPQAWKTKQTSISIPTVEIIDSPRFAHRAFMLDVARNFQPKEEIFKVLDLMALYKLNVFHFHFNDDEGWRIEIPGLPELTEVGVRKGHSTDDKNFLHPSFGSGFYTRQDFIDILKYANERHIKVIPEIETPGHARAAIAAMTARYERLMKEGKKAEAEKYMLYDPQDSSKYRSVQRWFRNVINPALPSTYSFLEYVVDELRKMYSEAAAPLETVHFGGDEVPGGVWTGSPAVKELMKKESSVKNVNDLWYYYFGKVTDIMKKRGMYVYGWEEAGMRKTGLDGRTVYIPNPDFVNTRMQVDVWNNVIGWGAEDLPYQLANAGYKVILSPASNMYFDLAYHKEFDEPGYYWAGYLDTEKPFSFIPFDYYKNTTEDINGNRINKSFFVGKERLTDFGKENIPGLQGLLWSETLRSSDAMEYMLLPKLHALAERAWAKDPEWVKEKDSTKAQQLYNNAWSHFVNVIGKRELPRLDYYAGGFNYRIPTVGAVVKDGRVEVNTQIPGFVIRYTVDGNNPDLKSKIYTGPINEKGSIKLRLFDSRGRGGRTIEVNNQKASF
jgi:hexosaminidase